MASMCIDLSKKHLMHRSQNQLSLNSYPILKYHANHKSVLNAQKSIEMNIYDCYATLQFRYRQ